MTKPQSAVERVEAKLRAVGLTLAKVCDLHRTTPYQWRRANDQKNGRGGRIPDCHFDAIMKASKKHRAGVTEKDLVNK